MVVGILAFQGDVAEHRSALTKLSVPSVDVRSLTDLQPITHLIIPGGESTVMGMFLKRTGMDHAIFERSRRGSLSIFGTCAGAIILAKLGAIDMEVERNAYGSQSDSFDAEILLKESGRTMRAAFIRGPKITHVSQVVEILAEHEENPVIVRQANVLAATCHPELRGETLLHEMFLGLR